MDAGRWELPTDVVVEILLRLPPISRRRVRLVCSLWRDIIDKHTTEMQSRVTALHWDTWVAVAHVVDDLSKSSTGSHTELWLPDSVAADFRFRNNSSLQLIGTCNGLLCLCDNKEAPGGAVTLFNPVIDEELPLPPLPCTRPYIPSVERYAFWEDWHEAYSFAYHPTSGQYKVVHVPCSINKAYKFDALQVLTLGEASWREVPAGPAEGASCNLGAGIVSVDGATYWVIESAGASWVVSLDLENEAVTRVKGLPGHPAGPEHYHLTEVHGRLGVVVHGVSRTTEVWVLDEGRRKWSCQYSLTRHNVPRPHFVFGECILTLEESLIRGYYTGSLIRGHYRQTGVWSSSNKAVPVRVSHRAHGRPLVITRGRGRTFPYVKTMEPLSIYNAPIVNR
ncbi:hypothetical protein CFC21_019674 [Triticum aestivum]|uniref:F-box domain-containing protein n=2 Tax=Triticum aestivum TaxID=4565 RepID=A0A3B6B6I2_WHEAT|nr:hypothetical protein CFC21_019674 [Triticum aestivum]